MKDFITGQATASGTPWRAIELRPQQRMPRNGLPPDQPTIVTQGMLTIDAVPFAGQRQILDFLMPGDVVCLTPFLATPAVSLRAITASTLAVLQDQDSASTPRGDDLRRREQRQLERALVHQLMIGHLESEARVASGLLCLAYRDGGQPMMSQVLPLPMSRDDIADFLAMNRDTLSRIMMRLEGSGLIARINRHSIRIANLSRLAELSPIAAQIAATCRRGPPDAAVDRA